MGASRVSNCPTTYPTLTWRRADRLLSCPKNYLLGGPKGWAWPKASQPLHQQRVGLVIRLPDTTLSPTTECQTSDALGSSPCFSFTKWDAERLTLHVSGKIIQVYKFHTCRSRMNYTNLFILSNSTLDIGTHLTAKGRPPSELSGTKKKEISSFPRIYSPCCSMLGTMTTW